MSALKIWNGRLVIHVHASANLFKYTSSVLKRLINIACIKIFSKSCDQKSFKRFEYDMVIVISKGKNVVKVYAQILVTDMN